MSEVDQLLRSMMFPDGQEKALEQVVGFDSAVITECRRLEVKDLDLYVQMPLDQFNAKFLAARLPIEQVVARVSEDLEFVYRCLTAIRCHLGRQQYDATLQIPKTPEDLQQFEQAKVRLLSFENLVNHVFWYFVMEKYGCYNVYPLKLTEGFVIVTCTSPPQPELPH